MLRHHHLRLAIAGPDCSAERSIASITTASLSATGVVNGWRCLEVGCAHTTTTAWLAERVGSAGRLVVLEPPDGHAHLTMPTRSNLEIRDHDVRHAPMELDWYDLVHSRGVLETVALREAALARLVATVKPGGWLVVQAIDVGTTTAAALARLVLPHDDAPLLERAWQAVEQIYSEADGDATLGADLPRLFRSLGLTELDVQVTTPIVSGTGGDLFGGLAEVREQARQQGLLSKSELAAIDRLAADPAARFPAGSLVTVRGRRTSEETRIPAQRRPREASRRRPPVRRSAR